MRPTEKLAILTAIKKAVDDQLKAVRSEADDELLEAYKENGVEKLALKVGGEKVGNFIIAFNKESYEIDNPEAFNEFALLNGFAKLTHAIKPEFMQQAVAMVEEQYPEAIEEKFELNKDWDAYFEKLGDDVIISGKDTIVPGVVWKAPTVKSTQVRDCKPQVVLPIVQRLGGVDQFMLEAANE